MQQSWRKEADRQTLIYKTQKILYLLEAVYPPRRVAVMHCKEHQSDMSEISLESQKADREAFL